MAIGLLNHAKADADLDALREDPRFRAMPTAAEVRLATITQNLIRRRLRPTKYPCVRAAPWI